VDRAQHRGSLRILDGLQNFEADRFQSITDNANVIEGICERANARFVVLVADQERDALFSLRLNSGRQKQQNNCDGHPHPHCDPR
jgi:hypothetical protein